MVYCFPQCDPLKEIYKYNVKKLVWFGAVAVDQPKLVCAQVHYEAVLHSTGVILQCLVRSHPAVNATQALYSWTTLTGRNESITAGQRDGYYFADLRPGVRRFSRYRCLSPHNY